MSCSNNRCQTCKVVNIGPTTVKQWYESNVDTNVFTDKEKTRLNELINQTSLDGKDGVDGLPGINGTNGTNGRDGNRGATGNDGAQGFQGIPGKDGIDGANIPVPGPKGDTGLRGDVGIHGLDGKDGRDGLDGMSVIGPKGDEGDRGLQGIPGTIGHIGLDGHIGVDGRAGTSGVPGPRGQVGANGLDGKDGTVGGIVGNDTEANILLKSGNVGEMWIITDPAKAGQGLLSDGNGSGASHWTNIGQLAGPRGVQGIQGLDGADGSQGLPGPVGPQSTVPGPSGPIGNTGAQGADSVVSGPQGVQGIQGDDGDKGDPGTPILTYIAEADLPPVGDMTKIYKVNRNATGLYDIRYLVWDNIHNDYIPLPADVASSADGSVGYRALPTSSLTIKEDRSNLDVIGEIGNREINIFDGNVWKGIYSERQIKEWIAAGSKFEGIFAEDGHIQGGGVVDFTHLKGMMSTSTLDQLLGFVGHYYTWNGTDGYVIKTGDLDSTLVGNTMNTGDWLQLVNSGGKITDPTDPLFATQQPDFHIVHIAGDSLTKQRADGLYSFADWSPSAYEIGSLITYKGKAYTAVFTIAPSDSAPDVLGSKWLPIDLSSVVPITYTGSGGFDYNATVYESSNNWGMPSNVHPNPHKRRPRDGDKYIDLLNGSEVDFKVNTTTHAVTAIYTAGHTREFEIDITAHVGENFELLKFLPRDTSDLTITVEAIEPDGATYDMRYIASEGSIPLLTPIGINSHNSTISSFGVLDKAGVDYVVGTSTSSAVVKYRVIVSSKYHDISQIEVGDGIAITDSFVTTVDGSINYPNKMDGNIITKKLLPAVTVPSYKGQVHYDQDDVSQKMMLKDVAYDKDNWGDTIIGNTPVGTTGGTQARGILVMTQAEYDAIPTKDTTTLYFIEEI